MVPLVNNLVVVQGPLQALQLSFEIVIFLIRGQNLIVHLVVLSRKLLVDRLVLTFTFLLDRTDLAQKCVSVCSQLRVLLLHRVPDHLKSLEMTVT